MIEGGERPAVADKLEAIGYTRYVFDGVNLVRADDKISLNSFFFHTRHVPRPQERSKGLRSEPPRPAKGSFAVPPRPN
jgi:hypothetical protein